MTRKATSRAAAAPKSDRIIVLPQPSSLPRNNPSTSRNSEELKVARPAQSMRVALGSRLSRSLR